jgi:hypothetical protein
MAWEICYRDLTNRVNYDEVCVGGTMEPCVNCGAEVPPEHYDVYCARCLAQIHEALAKALLEGFMSTCWHLVEGRLRGDQWRRSA